MRVVTCAQVDNKTDLEYQAGQDENEDGVDDDKQQKPADGSKPQEKQQPEGTAGEEEQQEDVPEQVTKAAGSSICSVQSCSAWLCDANARPLTSVLLLVKGHS
jgi:hypothetical protein